jgi:hypothetical protein
MVQRVNAYGNFTIRRLRGRQKNGGSAQGGPP